MAQPASRTDLINYCKRQLGAPVLEINVADEQVDDLVDDALQYFHCLLYTSPSPRDRQKSRMPSSA